MRVLDLTDEQAVYGTRLLADLGADVVRVETPSLDGVRRNGSAFHAYFNAGKRSVAADVTTAEGRDVFLQLCGHADVIVEGLTAAWDPLDDIYVQARRRNPRLVWVAARPFVPSVREMRTSEIVRYALSGLMSITGVPGEPPMLVGGGLSNAVVGLYAAVAAYAGTMIARQAGEGMLLWVSGYEALVQTMQQGLYQAAFTGRTQSRTADRHGHVATAGALRCRDGYLVISAHEPASWRRLVSLVGDERLTDARLEDPDARKQRADEIFATIGGWARGRAKQELADAGQDRRIPVAPVHDARDVGDDAHLRARGFFQDLGGRMVAVLETPWLTSRQPAPALGQHSAEVISEDRATLPAREGARRG